MIFERRTAIYRNRFRWGQVHVAVVRWIPVGVSMGALLFVLRASGVAEIHSGAFAVAVLPVAAAGLFAALAHREVAPALYWLDHASGGRQELPAAWEIHGTGSPLEEPLRDTAVRILDDPAIGKLRPRPGPMANLTALAFVAAFAYVLMLGDAFFPGKDGDVAARGAELEAWAEVWAEGSDDGGAGYDLAERMESLGRRMSDGALNEGQAERALRQLEEDIQERRDDLVRDKLAESLNDDLDLDRDSAEAFRVGKRRLSADVLAELEGAVADSPFLRPPDRELLERLLSDPSMRSPGDRASRELTEDLTEALKEALDLDDPLLDQLDEAAAQSRRARSGPSEEQADEGNDGRGESGDDGDGLSFGGENRGDGESGDDPGDSADRNGRSGGSGRGSIAVDDESTGTLPPRTDTTDSPMRLPSETDGGGSWRTVIRAYGDENGSEWTSEADGLPPWTGEVESVITREDIPPGLRDYVRDYFLALEEGPSGTDDAMNEETTGAGEIGTAAENSGTQQEE